MSWCTARNCEFGGQCRKCGPTIRRCRQQSAVGCNKTRASAPVVIHIATIDSSTGIEDLSCRRSIRRCSMRSVRQISPVSVLALGLSCRGEGRKLVEAVVTCDHGGIGAMVLSVSDSEGRTLICGGGSGGCMPGGESKL
nr:hypothetical protein CFP56_69086 [Quercus suber]